MLAPLQTELSTTYICNLPGFNVLYNSYVDRNIKGLKEDAQKAIQGNWSQASVVRYDETT